MKKALVCGAGGFIGGHLVKYLKSKGYWVRGVDLKYNEFHKVDEVADQFDDENELAYCHVSVAFVSSPLASSALLSEAAAFSQSPRAESIISSRALAALGVATLAPAL